jgi:hypothetical protein
VADPIVRPAGDYRELRGEPWNAPIDVQAIMRGMHELQAHWGAAGAT